MLYKFTSSNWIENLIVDKEIRFTQFTALNDPFESAILMRLDDAVKSLCTTLSPTALEIMQELEKPSTQGRMAAEYFSSLYGILSLSRNVENMLMWAHYAESHTGFAIGFDETHEFFKDSGENDFDPALKKVTYSANRMVHEPFQEQLFCHKSIDWCYEEEERLFKTLELGRDTRKKCTFGMPVYLFNIPADAYKAIYIGANMSVENKKTLISLSREHLPHVDIYLAEVCEERYSLVFRKQT